MKFEKIFVSISLLFVFTSCEKYKVEDKLIIQKIVYEGDSITDTSIFGFSTNYPNQLIWLNPAISHAVQVNVAEGGDEIQAFIATKEYELQIYPERPINQEKVIFMLMMGTNDLSVGRSPQEVYDNLKTVWARAKADGFIVVALCITRSTIAIRDNGAIALNSLIIKDPSLYDYLIRTDLILPDPNDTTYFSDGTHTTEKGSRVIANNIISVLGQ